VFVAPRFHTNQVGIVKALLARGHNVVFHTLLRGETEDHSALAPVIVPEARLSKLIRRFFGDRGTNRPRAFPSPFPYYMRLKETRPDIIIVRDPSRFFSLLAAACARMLGARVVFYSQDLLLRRYSPARTAATWLFLKLFSAAWYTPLLGAARNEGPPKGRYFLPFVVEGGQKKEKVTDRTTVLMVGKYNRRKNHLLLVEALAPIMTERDLDAIIVGECVTPAQIELRGAVVSRVRELGLEDRILLLDNVPYHRMPELYRSADLFVLPASGEPAAISVLEAIAFGVPAICSDTCGTRFYIKDGLNGAVFQSDSRQDLERVLLDWLEDETRLRSAWKSCGIFAQAELSGDAFYDRFKAMILDRWPAEASRW
jgi:glycosyltransferase involved in cell wall biosynthesis